LITLVGRDSECAAETLFVEGVADLEESSSGKSSNESRCLQTVYSGGLYERRNQEKGENHQVAAMVE